MPVVPVDIKPTTSASPDAQRTTGAASSALTRHRGVSVSRYRNPVASGGLGLCVSRTVLPAPHRGTIPLLAPRRSSPSGMTENGPISQEALSRTAASGYWDAQATPGAKLLARHGLPAPVVNRVGGVTAPLVIVPFPAEATDPARRVRGASRARTVGWHAHGVSRCRARVTTAVTAPVAVRVPCAAPGLGRAAWDSAGACPLSLFREEEGASPAVTRRCDGHAFGVTRSAVPPTPPVTPRTRVRHGWRGA